MNPHLITIIQNEARRLAWNGNREAALEALDRIPRAEGAVLRAQTLGQLGRFTEAAESWRDALALDPKNEQAKRGLALATRLGRSSLGHALLYIRHSLAALAALAVVLSVIWIAKPEPGPTNRQLADSIERLERLAAALDSSSRENAGTTLRRLEQTENKDAQAHEQLRLQLQRLQQSVRNVEKTLAATPQR